MMSFEAYKETVHITFHQLMLILSSAVICSKRSDKKMGLSTVSFYADVAPKRPIVRPKLTTSSNDCQ